MADDKHPIANFMKWLFSSKPAGDYGRDPNDKYGLNKTQGQGDAKKQAIKELTEDDDQQGSGQ